jgi:hypothetical protein
MMFIYCIFSIELIPNITLDIEQNIHNTTYCIQFLVDLLSNIPYEYSIHKNLVETNYVFNYNNLFICI